ncbi:MAG: class II D-tagatose-bisphosphate aldolase, non-catalytic subunit [Synergistaceae bacterium]|nr:class II D-tagatose-bisphosphate aldolase, non-catalytic subunit [Synergistaceae bacterium]
MFNKNPLLKIINKRQAGEISGIPSYCTANELAIEALLEQGAKLGTEILIEGTANQINQFGGYTGMTPEDFRDYVFKIAERVGFDKNKIILGADHFGPLVWSNLNEKQAMKNSLELVRLAVRAGFKKIHLDTSMKLADDAPYERLSDEKIAERGAILLAECEKTYQELLKQNPEEVRPVYIIGSEVPIPGGAQEEEVELQVTKVSDFENTLRIYKKKFEEHGLSERWGDVIGVVVQPGVEFGDKEIHFYNREAAKELSAALKKYPGVVFEGHSTDYQSKERLREMVEDGIAILKVGPALTFALREGLFALSMIESELMSGNRAEFEATLEKVMLENPSHWQKHYQGSNSGNFLARRYSYSDRCRYYFSNPEVKAAIKKLFTGIDSFISHDLLLPGLLRQYMPRQYKRVRDGEIKLKADALVKDFVVAVAEDYNFAAGF